MKLFADYKTYSDTELDDIFEDLTSFVNKKIYESFKDKNNGQIISDFIDKYLESNVDFLDIIDRFIIDNNIVLSKDDTNILLKNTTILNYLKKILGNKNSVNIDTYSKYFDSSFASLLFTVYCNLSNIEVDEKIKNNKIFSPEEEKEIFIRLKNGEDVREEIILRNQGLVKSIASKYGSYGELEDLVQEGFIGLFKAIDKFDYTKGIKFSTYATWWIKQSIKRSLADKSRTIRIPVHTGEIILKINRIKRELTLKLGHDPSIEELSAETGYSVHQLNDYATYEMEPTSLNKPVGEDDSTLGDFIGTDDSEKIENELYQNELKENLNLALNTLSAREKDVIIKRYGLIDDKPRTLEDVGNEYGVTRERIRQIESKALRKLRRPAIATYIRPYFDDNENNKYYNINEIINIFNNLKVKNYVAFNIFINMLNKEELIALRKTFNASHIPKNNPKLTQMENQRLLKVISLFNGLKSFLINDNYCELLGNLACNQTKVNIYKYLDFNDKYILECIISYMPSSYRKDLYRFFDFNTGKLRNVVCREAFIKIANLIREINYVYYQKKLPKDIYVENIPKLYSIYELLESNNDKEIIMSINRIDTFDQAVIFKLFGINFNEKIDEEDYFENIDIINRLKFMMNTRGNDLDGKRI
jgi:RNA polymerase primary sigma factor